MYKCNNNNNICEEIKSTQKFDKEWELKCYIHYNIKDKDLITVFYLNIKSIIKSYNLKNPGWEGNVEAHSGLLNFKWTADVKNDYYSMFAIGINGNRIELFLMKFTYDNEFKYGMIKNRNISQCLNYSYARLNDNNLYFITYNDTTFISGFTKLNGEVTKENIDSINMTINENSPLNFYDEITINKINFIEESQYVYYNISTDKNETYYGIIDIESNKVIYNTNKEISEFKPFSNSSMLAISGSSAYLICTFKNKNSNECLYKCDNNNPLYRYN